MTRMFKRCFKYFIINFNKLFVSLYDITIISHDFSNLMQKFGNYILIFLPTLFLFLYNNLNWYIFTQWYVTRLVRSWFNGLKEEDENVKRYWHWTSFYSKDEIHKIMCIHIQQVKAHGSHRSPKEQLLYHSISNFLNMKF